MNEPSLKHCACDRSNLITFCIEECFSGFSVLSKPSQTSMPLTAGVSGVRNRIVCPSDVEDLLHFADQYVKANFVMPKTTPYRKSGKPGKHLDFVSGRFWGASFIVNFKKSVLLHFGVVTFNFSLSKNPKKSSPVMSGPGGRVHAPPETNYFELWICRIIQNSLRKNTTHFQHMSIGNFRILKSKIMEKTCAGTSWRSV